MTPTSNQQPHQQVPTPKEDRRIIRRIRSQGWEVSGRTGEGGGGAKKYMNIEKSYRRDGGNGGDLGGRRKYVYKQVLVQ